MHLLVNMVTLAFLGRDVAILLGTKSFAALYGGMTQNILTTQQQDKFTKQEMK
jgi:membrane associated rhomboid family serine protease